MSSLILLPLPLASIFASLWLLPMRLCTAYHLQPPLPPCSDYEMLIANTKQCVRRCPIRCINGVCFESDVCPCDGFYRTSFGNSLICAADCVPGCKRAGGFCAAADLCVCRKGFYYDEIARRCRKRIIFIDRCRGRCLYGKCNAKGECICTQGFVRQTASFFSLHRGQLCMPVCQQDCGPRGYCHLPNMCACRKKHHHYEKDGMCHKDYFYL